MVAESSRDWSVFKQIFADHWEEFQRAHPRYQTSYYDGLVAKMLDCGNPEKMGYVEYRCLHCGLGKHLVSMSCKSSLCLRCAKVYVDNWVSQVSKMLHEGVIYRHIILTVPAMFRTTFTAVCTRGIRLLCLSLVVIFAGGYRSSASTGILARLGCTHLCNVVNGTRGWVNAGYAVEPVRATTSSQKMRRTTMADVQLDCQGLRCPIPIVRISQAMKTMHAGQILEVTANDRAFNADVRAWVSKMGHELLAIETGSVQRALIRKV
jgi:TusA-related sulfurtransferase